MIMRCWLFFIFNNVIKWNLTRKIEYMLTSFSSDLSAAYRGVEELIQQKKHLLSDVKENWLHSRIRNHKSRLRFEKKRRIGEWFGVVLEWKSTYRIAKYHRHSLEGIKRRTEGPDWEIYRLGDETRPNQLQLRLW